MSSGEMTINTNTHTCIRTYLHQDDKNIQGYANYIGFPGGSVVKNLPANAGDTGLTPRSGRSHGKENGNPLQCSCLGNPKDRGAWQATVHGVTKESNMT